MTDNLLTRTVTRVITCATTRATEGTRRRAGANTGANAVMGIMLIGAVALGVSIDTTTVHAFDSQDTSRGDPFVWLAGVDTPGDALDVSLDGSYAYVADREGGLQVIDISDPEVPKLVGSMGTPSEALDGHVVGGHAYIATRADGLIVADLSSPTNPAIVGDVPTSGSAIGLVVVGGYAYIADREAGLQVIDVSDPTNPVIVGTVNTPYRATDVAVVGSFAYVADVIAGLQIIDVSTPSEPAIVGTVPSVRAIGVTVSGATSYVVGGGLHTIDVSDPANPVVLGSAPAFDTDVRDVVVAGRYAYIVDSVEGLQAIDISDPTNPTIFAALATDGSASGIAVTGTFAFVADGAAGLEVIDITALTPLGTDDDADGGGTSGVLSPSIVGVPFPRPAGDFVTMRLQLDDASFVRVTLHDVAGRRLDTLVDRRLEPGAHGVNWTRGTHAPGVYFFHVEMNGRSATRRIVIAP